MAMNLRIDFDNRYKIDDLYDDVHQINFTTILKSGEEVFLRVQISDKSHELMENVYNLSFGTVEKGRIDDKIKLAYENYSKVFSTILFFALTYLIKNPGHFIGIDGSDNLRTYLYYRILHLNFDYLDKYFDVWGIKYYARITRFGKHQYTNPFDFDDIMSTPIKIEKNSKIDSDFMYNYFVLSLKKY